MCVRVGACARECVFVCAYGVCASVCVRVWVRVMAFARVRMIGNNVCMPYPIQHVDMGREGYSHPQWFEPQKHVRVCVRVCVYMRKCVSAYERALECDIKINATGR